LLDRNQSYVVHSRHRKSPFVDLDLGDLPVAHINQVLGLELDPGRVIFSAGAQSHAFSRHETEYPSYVGYLSTVISNPMFIGDDFRNEGKIELIARIPNLKTGLLVAVTLDTDRNGNYHLCSAYPISEKKIQGRLEKKFLKRVII